MQEKRHDRVVEMRLCFFLGKVGDYNVSFVETRMCRSTNWFQNQGRWQGAGSMPSPGAIIFFDWDHDGTCDHVGIVERCDGTTVYTVEGNSGDAVRERSYAIRSDSIMGYGMVVY